MTDKTKLLFGETIGNPAGNVLDIEALARIAHAHGAPLMVDNTFATPYLCRPFEWGADIVVHSATKFIGGHGTSIGGVVVDNGTFDWSNGRYPVVAAPSPAYHGLKFHENFGIYGYLMKLRAETLRDLGAALAPLNAFLFMQGLETLPLRMQAHVANALAVARFLDSDPRVERVRYAGLDDSPYRRLREKYLPRGAGAVFCFDLAGGREAGRAFIESLQLFSHLANVGDAKSLVIHPASTTHRQLDDAELARRGHRPRHDPVVDRHRRRRRPDLGSARGARRPSNEIGDAMSDYQDPRVIQRLLHTARTIAIVGLSSNPLRPSHFVGFYLLRHGYRVIPVNPREREVLGQRSVESLAQIDTPVDIVDVFREPSVVPEIATRRARDRRKSAVAAIRRDSRSGRRASARRRARRRHGSLPENRTRALSRPHALARLQHRRHQRAAQPRAIDGEAMLKRLRAWRLARILDRHAIADALWRRVVGELLDPRSTDDRRTRAVARTGNGVPAPEDIRWDPRPRDRRLHARDDRGAGVSADPQSRASTTIAAGTR